MIQIGIVGAKRGWVYRRISEFTDSVRIHSVCDVSEAALAPWKQLRSDVKFQAHYQDLLSDPEVTAVFVATPPSQHAEQSIRALQAGKHVLSEIPAMVTLEDGARLIQAVRQSRRLYMLAENYCYIPENRFIRNLCEQDALGKITFAEGRYVHECRDLFWDQSGNLTWRGRDLERQQGNTYPTHALGPLAQWIGLGERDRITHLACFGNGNENLRQFAKRSRGGFSALNAPSFAGRDTTVITLQTANGVLIVLYGDLCSPRPSQKAGYAVQGTTGAYVSGRFDGEEGLIYLEPANRANQKRAWQPLSTYARDYFEQEDIPAGVKQLGTEGPDYLVLLDFADAILNQERPPIDVFDAVTWSSVVPLSHESACRNGALVEMPRWTE